MSMRNYVSPWITVIQRYSVDGVKRTIKEKCETVTVTQMSSKNYEPNGSKVTAWYGVVLYVKKRKNQYKYTQRNKQGCTIPIDNYARFVVMQQIDTSDTVIMFVPGSTLATNFFVQQNTWIGSGVVLIDPNITGIWNDNAVITTKHPFIPFNVQKNLQMLPKIDNLPHSFRFNESCYQGFCIDDLDPPQISEINLVPACPNSFCDSNHGLSESCPAAVGTSSIKVNCLEGIVTLSTAAGGVKIPFMSKDFTQKLISQEIVTNPNRVVPITFLRKCVQLQLEAIRRNNLKWFVLGWYRVKKEDGLQSYVSKFHISKIGCNADTEAIRIPLWCSDIRQEYYFPDIYRNRILIPRQREITGEDQSVTLVTEEVVCGNTGERATNTEEFTLEAGNAAERSFFLEETAVDETLSREISENSNAQRHQSSQVQTAQIQSEFDSVTEAVAKEWENRIKERDEIISMNKSVNRPLHLAWMDSLTGDELPAGEKLICRQQKEKSNNPGQKSVIGKQRANDLGETSKKQRKMPKSRIVYTTKTGRKSKKPRVEYYDEMQTQITDYLKPTRRPEPTNAAGRESSIILESDSD